MTYIRIWKNQNNCCGFRVEGHSGYGQEGGDIVCASISSAVMLTINGIFEVAHGDGEFTVKDENTLIEFMIGDTFTKDKMCSGFLNAFELHANCLCEEFSEYILIDYKEVQTNDKN